MLRNYSFLKSDDVDAFKILAGREFQIGITRDKKKYLRRLVRMRGTVSLNGWPRVLVLYLKVEKSHFELLQYDYE